MATHPTTAEEIRDRIIEVMESIDLIVMPGERLRAFRNEGGADFVDWCEANPGSARRRFQVRDMGHDESPLNTNLDVEERSVTFSIVVAYPQTGRDGRDQALDRDDAMNSDRHQIEQAIGIGGRSRFSWPTGPDAFWDGQRSSTEPRVPGVSCDFLEMVQTYTFKRSMT